MPVLTDKKVIARKEHYDSCRDHLDFGIVRYSDSKFYVNQKEIDDLQISKEDAEMLQRHCDKNFKILKGELHRYQSGTYDGDFYSVHCSIELSDFLTKYDLWYEE